MSDLRPTPTIPTPHSDDEVMALLDVITDARMRGIGSVSWSMALAILNAGYRRTIVSPAGEPVCQHCHPAPVTFRCRELGHAITPN
ncbi:hypothetical protein [Micromonospora sp. CA-248212]|uniref:hypothetical protein n=1 Tax=Micromonospora sp. CA-248212 TaxID=3239961 RepID=UPI003D8F1398